MIAAWGVVSSSKGEARGHGSRQEEQSQSGMECSRRTQELVNKEELAQPRSSEMVFPAEGGPCSRCRHRRESNLLGSTRAEVGPDGKGLECHLRNGPFKQVTRDNNKRCKTHTLLLKCLYYSG